MLFLRKEKDGNAELGFLVLTPSIRLKSLFTSIKKFIHESSALSLCKGFSLITFGSFLRALYTLSYMILCPIVLNLLTCNFCSINTVLFDFSSVSDSLLEQE